MNYIYKTILTLIIIFSILIQSCRSKINYNCFGASTPVDLTLINSLDKGIDLRLIVYSEIDEFRVIREILMDANQEKTICLENEGSIRKGIYIYHNGKTSKIKLKSTGKNIFNVNDTLNIIETPEKLKVILK